MPATCQYLVAHKDGPPALRGMEPTLGRRGYRTPTWRIVEAESREAAAAAANPPPGATVHVVLMANVTTFTRDLAPGFTPA